MIRRTVFHAIPLAAALTLAGLSACQSASAASDAVALPAPTMDAPKTAAPGDQVAVLSGGCFWGVEAVFEHVKGVRKVVAGYSGGAADTAHYDEVSEGNTGHAESVRVQFDPAKVSYGTLLQVYFSVALDPTELDRQGPDTGTQYRSVIFYGNDEQKKVATDYIAQLTVAKSFPAPIVTQVVPLKASTRPRPITSITSASTRTIHTSSSTMHRKSRICRNCFRPCISRNSKWWMSNCIEPDQV